MGFEPTAANHTGILTVLYIPFGGDRWTRTTDTRISSSVALPAGFVDASSPHPKTSFSPTMIAIQHSL
jgi:hypothetical protein